MLTPWKKTLSSMLAVLLLFMNSCASGESASGDSQDSVPVETSFDGSSIVNWDGVFVNMEIVKDQRMSFILPLNEAQYYNMLNAELRFLQRNGDGSYAFINSVHDIAYKKNETTESDYTVYGEFNDFALFLVDQDGNRLSKSLEYQWVGSNALLIPAELSYQKENDQEPVFQQVMIYASLEKDTKTVSPEAILVWNENTLFWHLVRKNKFDDDLEIRLHHPYKIKSYDQMGRILPFDEWTIAKDEIWQGNIESGWLFKFMSWPESFDRFALFEIQSTDELWHAFLSSNIDYWPDINLVEYALPDWLCKSYDGMGLLLIKEIIPQIRSDRLLLSASIKNISEQEMKVTAEHLNINGKSYETSSICYGSGANGGILPNEEGFVGPLTVQLDMLREEEFIISMTFDLVLENPQNNNIIKTIPVVLSMVWDI